MSSVLTGSRRVFAGALTHPAWGRMKVDGKAHAHDLGRGRSARSASSTRPCCRTGSRTRRLETLADAARAIKSMQVRGAPVDRRRRRVRGRARAARGRVGPKSRAAACTTLAATRARRRSTSRGPLAENDGRGARPRALAFRVDAAYARAAEICEEECRQLPRARPAHGLALIEAGRDPQSARG